MKKERKCQTRKHKRRCSDPGWKPSIQVVPMPGAAVISVSVKWRVHGLSLRLLSLATIQSYSNQTINQSINQSINTYRSIN
jgi:hypothetical protein